MSRVNATGAIVLALAAGLAVVLLGARAHDDPRRAPRNAPRVGISRQAPPAAIAAQQDALGRAAYGTAEIWWQRKPSDRKRRELVFRARPDAAARVLDIPASAARREWDYHELALGLDGRGRLVVVLASRHGLRWTRVTGRVRQPPVPG
jgi:hypothetical protein